MFHPFPSTCKITPATARRERATWELESGIWLDPRRAVWLARSQTLAVADLHLGYAWAHRHSGQMLPLSAPEDTLGRLIDLLRDYDAKEVIVLGDIVHRAVPVAALESELRTFWTTLGGLTSVRLILGNHDSRLDRLLSRIGIPADLSREIRLGPHLLVHGDESAETAAIHLREAAARNGRVLIGHEHPAIRLSDGVTTSLKFPCFAISPGVVGLPAFSEWAAGGDIRRGNFLSHYLTLSPPKRAIACVGSRILPVSWK